MTGCSEAALPAAPPTNSARRAVPSSHSDPSGDRLPELDQSTRLRFLCVDETVRQALRNFRPLLVPHIDRILDAIYANVDHYPVAAKAYTNLASYDDLKRGQKTHFLDQLFMGVFGEEYFGSVVKAARARERAGIEPRWYLGSYAVFMQKVNDIAVAAYRKKPHKLAATLAALNRAVLLDIDLAVTVYFEATRETAAQRLNGHADIFDRYISGMVGIVASAATELESTAETLASGATRASEDSTAVAAAAEEASASVQTVAAATEELSASINEISRRVQESTLIVRSAVEEADRTNAMMQGLADASGKIGNVVKVICDIARQTNLLALNATIEARRVGEVGKGFAVVAGEVKTLAKQTAGATDEITAQVVAVQKAMSGAVGAIQGIGVTIGRISENTAGIAAAVEEQDAATHEIARNIQQAAQSTTTVTTTITSVATSVGHTGEASRHVLTASQSLAHQSERLSAEVSRFLSVIRKEG